MKASLCLSYLFVTAASVALCANPPMFQIRLATTAAPGIPAPANCDKMTLRKVNRPNGETSLEVLYVQSEVLLDQYDVQATHVVTSETSGQPVIDVAFTDQGRKRFAEITRHNIDRRLAIIIEGTLYSAPVIRTEIPGGRAQINGDFTRTEAEELSKRINEALGH